MSVIFWLFAMSAGAVGGFLGQLAADHVHDDGAALTVKVHVDCNPQVTEPCINRNPKVAPLKRRNTAQPMQPARGRIHPDGSNDN